MSPSPWELISSSRVFTSRWLSVLEKRYRLPRSGHEDSFYVCEYPTWVCIVPVTDEGAIVLIRQYRPGLDRVVWEIPAGVVDEGESVLDAARRELSEETGYEGGAWERLITLSAGTGTHTNLSHTFLARGVVPGGTQRLDLTEDIDVEVRTVSEVGEMLRSGAIPTALHAASLLLFLGSSSPEK
jgi:8-oxo-dGTP pyrophosphatase MutT (NUDIX family)